MQLIKPQTSGTVIVPKKNYCALNPEQIVVVCAGYTPHPKAQWVGQVFDYLDFAEFVSELKRFLNSNAALQQIRFTIVAGSEASSKIDSVKAALAQLKEELPSQPYYAKSQLATDGINLDVSKVTFSSSVNFCLNEKAEVEECIPPHTASDVQIVDKLPQKEQVSSLNPFVRFVQSLRP